MFDRYVIKKGENLNSVADRLNTNLEFLKEINNIPYSDMIKEGMEIIVPFTKGNYFNYYKIEKGDTLYEVARKYNINPELLASMNGFASDDYIYPGQDILIPKSGFSYYITKEGDTLNTAAITMNTSSDNLLKHNEAIYLLAGQLLTNRQE